jgi:hypothetical protein
VVYSWKHPKASDRITARFETSLNNNIADRLTD